jgi:hypothetical protein
MKNTLILLFAFNFYHLIAQEPDSLSKYYITRKEPNLYISGGVNTLFRLEVLEVDPSRGYDTCQYFEYNFGRTFAYCGEFRQGIRNLIKPPGTWDFTRIKFDNSYKGKPRYVYYAGGGMSMQSKAEGDIFSQTIVDGQPLYDGIKMVLDMMMNKFSFDAKLISDSVETLTLRIINEEKLQRYLTPSEKIIKRGGSGISRIDSISGIYFNNDDKLSTLCLKLRRKWDTIIYDETNPKLYDYYNFKIEKKYIEDINKLDDLNLYLKENLGLVFIREKRLEKIWHIKFKENP